MIFYIFESNGFKLFTCFLSYLIYTSDLFISYMLFKFGNVQKDANSDSLDCSDAFVIYAYICQRIISL